MIDERMEAAINEQINAELYSAYIYYAMSAWLDGEGLGGMAAWMKAQTQEEIFHADKFFGYLCERGGSVKLEAIEGPQTEWESATAVFDHAYEHEQFVTGLINKMMDLAIELKDHATVQFLQWFVEEQVEEEDNTSTVAAQVAMVEGSGQMLMLDREMGTRVFTPPVSGEEA